MVDEREGEYHIESAAGHPPGERNRVRGRRGVCRGADRDAVYVTNSSVLLMVVSVLIVVVCLVSEPIAVLRRQGLQS